MDLSRSPVNLCKLFAFPVSQGKFSNLTALNGHLADQDSKTSLELVKVQ